MPGKRMAKSWTVVSHTTRLTTHMIGIIADNKDNKQADTDPLEEDLQTTLSVGDEKYPECLH